jgi:CRISPR-associated protein Cas2
MRPIYCTETGLLWRGPYRSLCLNTGHLRAAVFESDNPFTKGSAMRRDEQFVVISYDISSNRSRTKVMKTLQGHGSHVQYSVFECRLKPAQLRSLRQELEKRVSKGDSIRFYYISADDISRIEILGDGQVMQDKPFFLH